jgi:hypothetical protein
MKELKQQQSTEQHQGRHPKVHVGEDRGGAIAAWSRGLHPFRPPGMAKFAAAALWQKQQVCTRDEK